MASKEQIFGIMAGASSPMSRVQLEEKVGESYRRFQTQLDRWVKQELIEDTGNHCYILTDKGRDESLQEEIDNIPEGEFAETGEGKKEETQATAGTTEYQQFLRLGKYIGVVPMSLIKVTTDHIWNGGDYQDLKWVASGLQQMGIQRDLANRWLASWGSHLKQPLPAELPTYFSNPDAKKGEGLEADRKKGTGNRAYIIDSNDSPLWVGEGMGNLDYQDAVDISKLRAAGRAVRSDGHRDGSGDSLAAKAVEKVIGDMNREPAPSGDETEKMIAQFKALKELLGEGKPESGNDIEKTIAIMKTMRELFPENKPQLPSASPQRQMLYDKRTGEVTEVAPGQPVIIMRENAAVSQATPIQVKDKDGNPMVLDLSTYIRLEEHKEKQRRDEDSHQVKMDIAKTFKEALNKAGKALANMGEGEE